MNVADFFDKFDEACTTDGMLPTPTELKSRIVVKLNNSLVDVKDISRHNDGTIIIYLVE